MRTGVLTKCMICGNMVDNTFPHTCYDASALPAKGHPLFKQLTEDELKLHEEKNGDYRSDNDPLANFKRVSALMALWPKMDWTTPVGVALTYSFKQMDAALSLLERGVEGGVENVDTRLRDVHVYIKLVRILHREMNGRT
jgi:hypothetical protein